jgi:DNA-binding transcriptional LysR family regulator
MDAEDLLTFETVARLGGITRAATELHTVQSNVTNRVRRLEAEVGVPLFYRHSRGVSLTSAGEQLLPYAVGVRHLLSEARRAVIDDDEPSGSLIVGTLDRPPAGGYRRFWSITRAAIPASISPCRRALSRS